MTERDGIAQAHAKSNPESADRLRWLRWLLVLSVSVVAWSFGRNVALLVAAIVLLVTIEVIVSRFPSRRVMYACSLAVLLFAGVFTVGVVGDTRTIPSAVTGMWSQGGFGPEEYCVDVTCSEASSGKLSAILRKGDWERILHQSSISAVNPYPVELTYRTQSVLGISSLQPVADAVDSRLVLTDYRQYLRGGIVGRVALPVTLILGVLPLAYLLYKDGRGLVDREIRR